MSGQKLRTNAEADVVQKPKRKTRWMTDGPLLADTEELINDKEWTKTVRNIETQRSNRSLEDQLRRDSMCQAINGESFNTFPVSVHNRVSHLLSTQKWRKLLLNNQAQDAPISENIFKENVNVFLNGIEECARNPGQWTREDTDFFFNKIRSFVDSWNRQLLKEKESIEEAVKLIKEKLDNERDMVTNRLSMLAGIFDESLALIEFSECQKKAIQSKVQEFNDVQSQFGDGGQVNLALGEFTVPVKLENKDEELIEARKQADEYREELQKTKNSLKETRLKLNKLLQTSNQSTQVEQAIVDKCLQVKERELEKCRKQGKEYVQDLIETENKLKNAQDELRKVVAKNLEMTQSKQNEMNKKLSEIRRMLMMKQPENIPNCKTENKSLKQENNEILKDIKALIEYEIHLGKDNNCKVNSKTSALETDSGSTCLRVSEYEMHLVTLIASILKVLPFAVGTNFIYSIIANIDNIVDLQFVESLLKKFPSFFKEGALPGSSEKKWSYIDLKPVITI